MWSLTLIQWSLIWRTSHIGVSILYIQHWVAVWQSSFNKSYAFMSFLLQKSWFLHAKCLFVMLQSLHVLGVNVSQLQLECFTLRKHVDAFLHRTTFYSRIDISYSRLFFSRNRHSTPVLKICFCYSSAFQTIRTSVKSESWCNNTDGALGGGIGFPFGMQTLNNNATHDIV